MCSLQVRTSFKWNLQQEPVSHIPKRSNLTLKINQNINAYFHIIEDEKATARHRQSFIHSNLCSYIFCMSVDKFKIGKHKESQLQRIRNLKPEILMISIHGICGKC